MGQVRVLANGFKSDDDPQQAIAELIELLHIECLDPHFEDYGNFVIDVPEGVQVWGNFLRCPHVFDLRGPRAELQALIDEIRRNQATIAYQHAKEDHEVRLTARRERARALRAEQAL